jgi:hypothetical protein
MLSTFTVMTANDRCRNGTEIKIITIIYHIFPSIYNKRYFDDAVKTEKYVNLKYYTQKIYEENI